MWGARETRTGRIVYNRKKHALSAADVLRMAVDLELKSEFDVGRLSLALLLFEIKIEDFAGFAGNGINLAEIYPLWYNYLDAQKSEKWATEFRQKHPVKATLISIALEAWKALAAIRLIEKTKK